MTESKDNNELQLLKLGLALRILIIARKELAKDESASLKYKADVDDSYAKISSTTGVRAATISDIINGKSNTQWSTIISILEALNTTLNEFGSIYDRLTLQEILAYKKERELRKTKRGNNTKPKKD